MMRCFGYFCDADDYCWYDCPYSTECEEETFGIPECYGDFNDWNNYCLYSCPYSRSCEKYTWGSYVF